MSSHESRHCVKTLDYAIENTVSFLSFPPHTMNKMHLLHVTVHGLLSCVYNKQFALSRKVMFTVF